MEESKLEGKKQNPQLIRHRPKRKQEEFPDTLPFRYAPILPGTLRLKFFFLSQQNAMPRTIPFPQVPNMFQRFQVQVQNTCRKIRITRKREKGKNKEICRLLPTALPLPLPLHPLPCATTVSHPTPSLWQQAKRGREG